MGKNVQHIQVKTTGAKKSQKALKGVNSGLKDMAKKAGLAAAAYFGSQALLGAIKSSIDLFGKQELAEKKLRFAAKGMTDALIRQANALQQNTRFGDEQIIAQQAYLASLGLTQEQIEDTISASVDLAAATGMTLESAVLNTSKTLSGMAGELGEKLGPEFRELSQEALKAGEGIKFIAEQFGGTAQADAQSFTGQLDQMKNAVGDAQEALGEALAPVVTKVAKALKIAAEVWGDWIGDLGKTQLELTIDQLEDLGIAGEALIKLKNLKLERDIRTLNAELSLLNPNLLTSEEIIANIENLVLGQVAASNDLVTVQSNLTEERRKELESDRLLLKGKIDSLEASVQFASVLPKMYQLDIDHSEEIADLKAEILAIDIETGRFHLDQIDLLNSEIEGYEIIIDKNNQILLKKTQIVDLDNQEIEKTDEQIEKEKKLAQQLKIKNELKKAEKGLEKDLQKEILEKNKLMFEGNLKGAIQDAYKMAEKAYLAFAEIPLIGPALGAVAGVAAFALGMKYVAGMKSAQYGADFVTDGPQMMMVGEGSGPERVQVTPLSDPNLDGPQGQGITLNISGNVLQESFVEDNVIPQIREGLRLGENMGI